jgi:hypothetical protein
MRELVDRLADLKSFAMKPAATLSAFLGASAAVTIAWGGHELPVYPSFYPHEIEIRTLVPELAPAALSDARIHAYVGRGVRFSGAVPEVIGTAESLGSFVMVRVNPQSRRARDQQSTCAAAKSVVRDAARGDVVFHPYGVTPLHGDYLYHADLAEVAKARFTSAPDGPPVSDLRVKATGVVAQTHPAWSAPATDWDVEVFEVDAASLVVESTRTTNGWLAPPWRKAGWFHSERLLASSVSDPVQKERADSAFQRLTTGGFKDLTERVNLERDLVTLLSAGCRTVVAGYTVKHEYFNTEFSAGIESIGYDSIEGLHSPMFIRTAKLKDFPWNGWLRLGINASPATAWNPIGGMTDPFGRLIWSATGDLALLPSPYDAGWVLNRIADLPTNEGQ